MGVALLVVYSRETAPVLTIVMPQHTMHRPSGLGCSHTTSKMTLMLTARLRNVSIDMTSRSHLSENGGFCFLCHHLFSCWTFCSDFGEQTKLTLEPQKTSYPPKENVWELCINEYVSFFGPDVRNTPLRFCSANKSLITHPFQDVADL